MAGFRLSESGKERKQTKTWKALHVPVSPLQLTRLMAAQILQLPDNRTSPPSGTRWRRGRWYRLDLPALSTYTPHCCRGHRHRRLRHRHLPQHQESHRRGNQSWRWDHWSPSGCRRTCPQLSVTEEERRQGKKRGKGQQTHITTYSRVFAKHCKDSRFRQENLHKADIIWNERNRRLWTLWLLMKKQQHQVATF